MSSTTTTTGTALIPINLQPTAESVGRALAVIDNGAGAVAPDPTLDPDRRETIITYGEQVNKAAVAFADTVLKKVDTDQLGPLAEPLGEVRRVVNGLDPAKLQRQTWWKKLFGNARKEIADFRESVKSAGDQIDGVTMRLQDKKVETLAQIRLQDTLYARVEDMVRDLTPVIARAKATRQHWAEVLVPQRIAEADAAPEDERRAKSQRVQDLRTAIEQLGQTIDGLEKSRFILVTQGPAIRQIQAGAEQAATQIALTISQAVPLWKLQMVQALGVQDTLAGGKMVSDQADMMGKLLQRQAASLGQSVELQAANAKRGIVDVSALLAAHKDVQKALQRAGEIADEASKAREAASQQMAAAEGEFHRFLKIGHSSPPAAA